MKRTANIVIRVSPVEKKKLVALAKKEGLTFSAWVRRFAYVQSSVPRQQEVRLDD